VKVLFFDVGNTLIAPARPVTETYAEVLAAHGARTSPAALEPVFASVWGELARELEPGQDRYAPFRDGDRGFWRMFVRRVITRAGLEVDDAGPFEVLYEGFRSPSTWTVFPDVRPALAAFGRAGIRMGIISNWDSRLPDLLRALDLESPFDPIVVSGLEGIEKPNPEIFTRAAERAGVSPEACVYIGDSPYFDVRGARAAGMIPVLLRRVDARALVDVSDSEAETERSFADLPEVERWLSDESV
jgi:putative hydrolase of the HAD superfamily